MNVLLDINVVLDVLLNRARWVRTAADVWDAQLQGRINAYLAAFSVPTIFYIVRRQNDLASAHEAVRLCLETFQIVAVKRSTLDVARGFGVSDFEDALQIASALEAGVDVIVTRDAAGFASFPVQAISPDELLTRLPPHNPVAEESE